MGIVWVALDGDELDSAHLDGRQGKLANMRRDPRVVLSFEAEDDNGVGMPNYLVVHGRAGPGQARPGSVKGALPNCCTLAQTHVGPGTPFPAMPDPPPGFITHVAVTRLGGLGPWSD